jgi:hypothetical protein
VDDAWISKLTVDGCWRVPGTYGVEGDRSADKLGWPGMRSRTRPKVAMMALGFCKRFPALRSRITPALTDFTSKNRASRTGSERTNQNKPAGRRIRDILAAQIKVSV